MKKKILTLGLAATVAFTLTSCKEESVNKIVPYGSLNDSAYATLGSDSISKKQLYTLMKKDGYSQMLDLMKQDLFKDITTNKDYFDYSKDEDKYEINSKVLSDIYGVTTYEGYSQLKEEDKSLSLKKYIDNLYTSGIKKEDGNYFTENDIKSISISESIYDNEEVVEANFPQELYKKYIYEMAMNKYAISEIKNEKSEYYYKNEFVKGEGKNPYYITDKDVVDYYYHNGKNYGDYQGIVIKFASEAQAYSTINEALNGGTIPTDKDAALQAYIDIYNRRYVTRKQITVDNYLEDSNVNIYVNKNKNEFNNISSSFESFFKEMKNGEYLREIFNLDGSYYLVYRISGEDTKEWNELDEEQTKPGSASNETIYDKMLDNIIESKSLTTVQSKRESERYEDIVENGLVIYDPVYSYLYSQENDDYDLHNESNNDYIYKFTYNNVETKLSVDDLYSKLEAVNGTDVAIDYLSNKYYLSLSKMEEKIDSDLVSDYKSSLNNEIKQFKKGKKTYPKKIGVETYLQLTYGNDSVDALVSDYKASLIKEKALTYYGNHASSSNPEQFDVNSKLFKQFEEIYMNIYNDYFSTTISHILIGIDEDGTGNYADPTNYRNKLPESVKTEFDETIVGLANAIISEVNILKISKDVKDALDYIVTAFNNNYVIESLSYDKPADQKITWYEFRKQFPISLKAEDLGEISNSNASTYVKEFSLAAKSLYKDVKDAKIKESDVEDKGVLQFSSDINSVDSLCKTTYGFHILNIYGIGEQKSAKFTKENDSKDTDRENLKTYEQLPIVVIPDGDDDDDEPELTLTADGYSDNEYASASQLFIYFYEYVNGGSCKSLKSSCSTAVSQIFGGMITNYTSSAFKDWRMMKFQIKEIVFVGDEGNTKFNKYLEKLEKELNPDDKNEFTQYTDWVDSKYDWTIDFSK